MPQRQSVSDHLHPAIVQRIERCKVQIAGEDIGGNASFCLRAYLGGRALQRKASLPQQTHPGASCSMMAKLVKSVATSAVAGGEEGVGEDGDTTKCGMVEFQSGVALLVGNTVRATDANGPPLRPPQCFDRLRQLGPMGCETLFLQRHVRAVLPTKPSGRSGCASRAGGDSDISLQDGISNPASTRACSQVLTASKQMAGWWSIPRMITSATMGCLSLTILMQSAQLDQCTATFDLTADVSPRPPMESGKLAVTCASTGAPGPKNGTETTPHGCVVSFSILQSLVRSIMRNQKFARVDEE